MKKNKLIQCGIGCIAAVLLLQCQKSPVTGGTSDTEVSAQISGTATDQHGNAVAGAAVTLRQKEYLPSSQILKRQIALRNEADCVTDVYGHYSLDSINDGHYILEIKSGDTSGAVRECRIIDAGACTVSTVLKPLGTILGSIDFSYEGPFIRSKAKVEVYGTENLVRLDTNGFFQLSVAEGSHLLRISVDSSFFDILEINVDSVLPSEIRNIGRPRLNYLPFFPCGTDSCDSAVMRGFLDEAGHEDIPVHQVTRWFHGRIIAVNLRGLSISIPLTPLGRLNAVEEIDLGNTGTADSCRFLCGLWGLRTLRLDSNNLTGFSRCIEGLFPLQELDLSNNQLTMLPEKIVTLKPMHRLELKGNRLCNLSPFVAGWADTYDPGWREEQVCY